MKKKIGELTEFEKKRICAFYRLGVLSECPIRCICEKKPFEKSESDLTQEIEIEGFERSGK